MSTRIKTIKGSIGAVIAAVLLTTGVMMMTPASAAPATHATSKPVWMMRACKSEDSINCYWDAQKQGNGKGHSHYVMRIGKLVCVTYWQERYAHTHDYCAAVFA